MNLRNKVKKIVFSAVLIFFVIGNINAADLKIGYINFEHAFNSYKNTKTQNEKLQQKKDEKELAAKKMVDEINKLKAEAEILSEDAKQKAEKEIRDRLRDLRDYSEDAKKELLDLRNVIFKEITDEIRIIIEVMGKKDGYSFIFDDKALFYKEAGYDITSSLIDILNDDSKKKEYLTTTK